MPSPETARENGKKGGRKKGSKSWKTIEKDKLKEYYINSMRKTFAHLVDVHKTEALKPENATERVYAINQTIGKPIEKVEVEQTTRLLVDL